MPPFQMRSEKGRVGVSCRVNRKGDYAIGTWNSFVKYSGLIDTSTFHVQSHWIILLHVCTAGGTVLIAATIYMWMVQCDDWNERISAAHLGIASTVVAIVRRQIESQQKKSPAFHENVMLSVFGGRCPILLYLFLLLFSH